MKMNPYKMELENISKTYPSGDGTLVQALGPIDLRIPNHRFVSIVGPSGCGKSTLFNIISGLLDNTEGAIYVNGSRVDGLTGITGYMLQKDLLLPWRTILDNVILGLEIQGTSKREAKAKALPLLHKYGLKGFEDHYPAQLSGGMRQRAALLRTILYDRDVILLDEPFGALDAQTRAMMQEWLLDLWDDFQKTILFVTHDMEEAIYLSDEVYIMTSRPGTIKRHLLIDLPRPRKPQIITSPEFTQLKEEALRTLSEETLKAYQQEAAG